MSLQNILYSVCGHSGHVKQDRVQKLVEQYKEFRELFKSNHEIRQDFELLESIAFDEKNVTSRDPQSLSYGNLMLVCQRDGAVVTLVHIFHGVMNLMSFLQDERSFRAMSNTLGILIKFARFVGDFVTKSFPDTIDELDLLVADADNYVKNVCNIFMKAINKIVFTTDAIEKVFASDEEHRSRFDFGIRDLMNLNADNAAVLAEQTIVCTLRCSYVLILSYSMLSTSDSFVEHKDFFKSKISELQNNLSDLFSQCEKASRAFNTKFEEFMKAQTSDKVATTTVKGLSIPRELRFSAEVNLYENTIDMINRISEISSTLESIRSDSIKAIMKKSTKDQGDTDNSNLQQLQNELDKKTECFHTLAKLESQIISKVCSEKPSPNSKNTLISSENCPDDQQQNDPNDSATEILIEHDDEHECTYYAANTTEPDTSCPDQDHEGVLDELFELVTSHELDDEFLIDNDGSQVEGDSGVLEARQVVLEQLKTVLKPRHDIMKSREEEAYKRVYGERIAPEEEEEVTIKKTKRVPCEASNIQWDIDSTLEADDDDDDEIEDQVAEEQHNLFSSFDFKNRLDSILTKGAGRSNY